MATPSKAMNHAGGFGPGAHAFPVMRWAALGWLALWFPLYWFLHGWANFLHLCDVAIILTCIGLWRGSPLLLSSQLLGSLVVELIWCLDAAWPLFLGQHLVGGTEYMYNPAYPLWVRALSLYHVLWPPLLVWAVWKTGYDRRALALQSFISLAVITASRFIEPHRNLNFSQTDPIFKVQLGPAPVHLLVSIAFLIVVVYLPTDWALRKLLPAPGPRRPASDVGERKDER